MKCFERLVKDHITSTLPDTLDPLQFAYCPNRSTDDAISTTLHTALTHLDKRNTYVRMLFIDYSSAFTTIVPSKLVIKLETLGLDPALCNWVLDFLTGRPQVVRVGNNISTPLILNTGAPQGCVLSPLLYSLFTHDCVATHASNSIIKFADDTTVLGLITNNDETAYREEVRALGVWCQENNLTLNVNKTKEMIVDFRKQQREHPPIHIDGTVVERVASFKFLGIPITDKLNWSTHTDSIVKKAQQRLFNLRRLKKFGLSPKALTNFYRCTIESILAGCITAWYGNCSAHNRKALRRVVRSAQRITGGKLPALQDTYTTRCYRKAIKIIKDINHPSHCLFTPLSSRRRGQYRCIKAGTERLKNSFCVTKAIRLLNSHH
uniref:Reverse transcriptase domain-containing protein n=2 Tax=Oncorhynchus tshawytscha TaxID=74940 RepID=A0AAZ3PMN4_ONCTS